MHGTAGPSGKTLPLPELVEVVGPSILGAFNATGKVGTLLGGRPDAGLLLAEIVYTVGTAEQIFLDEDLRLISEQETQRERDFGRTK